MIEKIFHKNKMYALIVRRKFRKKSGINFFTSKEEHRNKEYIFCLSENINNKGELHGSKS